MLSKLVPVTFRSNCKEEKSFEADGFQPDSKAVLEIEAGRGYVNNQFLKDMCYSIVLRG